MKEEIKLVLSKFKGNEGFTMHHALQEILDVIHTHKKAECQHLDISWHPNREEYYCRLCGDCVNVY